MNITIPPSETDRNVEAIQRAIDNKTRECDRARDNLNNLVAELRGLEAALNIIKPKKIAP